MRDIKKILDNLLSLSKMIIDDFDILRIISEEDRENTMEFDKQIEVAKAHLDNERVVLNNLSFAEATELYRLKDKYDGVSPAADRAFKLIKKRFFKMCEGMSEEEIEAILYPDLSSALEDMDSSEYSEILEDTIDALFDKYTLDEGENKKYEEPVFNGIATLVIKRMLARIYYTLADNHQDEAYKAKLISSFKGFKYFFFTLNNRLEIDGITYRFNIDRLPQPYSYNIDTSTIMHNKCLVAIDVLLDKTDCDYSMESVLEKLFYTMILEECLKGVDQEMLDNLIEFIDEYENKFGSNYYGGFARKKVLEQKEKN